MLILTRRPGETIIIDDNIKVTIKGIKGNQVRLGIEAPKHITVNREEIQILKDKEQSINNYPNEYVTL